MEPNKNLPWIIFDLKHQLYAISTDMVTGISQIPAITSVAGAPAMFLGVCNVRGQVVPVLDLKALLKINDGAEETEKILTALSYKSGGVEDYLKELRRCVENKEKFAVDSNYFGDNIDCRHFHEKSETAALINRIHELQKELEACGAGSSVGKDAVARAEICGKQLVNAVNTTIEYISDTSKRMMICLSDDPSSMEPCMAFTVDTVKSVDQLELVSDREGGKTLFMSSQIYGVAHNDKLKGEILVIDNGEIIKTVNVYNEFVKKKEEEKAKKEATKKVPNQKAADTAH